MGKALAAWLMVAGAMAATAGPLDVVETAVTRVIVAMQEDPSREHARAEIRQAALSLFDFDEMARRTLTRHWAARSPQEQAEFVRLFTDLLERSYLGRIESWSDEKIIYTSEVVDGAFASVRSKIITRRAEIGIEYRLRQRDGQWRVYDVLLDGVSFVSTFRSAFDRILQQSSWAGLMDKLRKRAVLTTDRTPRIVSSPR
ncbi:MAG TPA: ABC transporter substrate-binding protein [Methylomirabilota bacterium]|jgi:phospholipid transport system substrate-binding protein|nr:ABC transporter substrate-binding protein [Methylomirabilota bacterium]